MKPFHCWSAVAWLVLVSLLGAQTTGLAQETTAPTPPECPVTIPNGSAPPEVHASLRSEWHGNGALWIIPWPEGKVLQRPANGRLGEWLTMKFLWRQAVPGTLTITGRRLDGLAPPLLASIADGRDDHVGFRPTRLIFPAEGCWEITGAVGNARLTIVQLVVKAETEITRLRALVAGDRAAALRLRELLQQSLADDRRSVVELGDSLRNTRRAVQELEAELAALDRHLSER